MSSLRPTPPAAHNPSEDRQRAVSAAADGETPALGAVCQAWRGDAATRADWHIYHLIGDVLRSEELASPPAREGAFLNRLRQRLADEPVVLAPSPTVRRPAAGWLVPAAVAAGFVVVAGVMVVSRVSSPTAPAAAEAMAAAPSQVGVLKVSNGAQAGQVKGQQGEGALIRDPRLDEFLRAHQAARGGMAVAAPGISLRRVDTPLPAGTSR